MTEVEWSQNLTAFMAEWDRKRKAGQDYDYLGDAPFPNFVLTSKAKSWDDCLRWIAGLKGSWYFRGQREAAWGLDTSLDRGVWRGTKTGYMHLDRKAAMKELLFRFKQDAHNFLTHVPAPLDIASWYALMQHFGAPTPLLDCTESPYVGLYFALEEKASARRKREHEPHSAIWAIDADWLEAKKKESLKADVFSYDDLLDNEAPLIIKINPLMSNPRLFAQQGLFLCRLFAQASFADMLMTMMIHPKLTDRPVIRKLEIGSSLRTEFLKKLRTMNIHRASLFPGLDGLGALLKLDLELKDRD
jgi:hypothetical protein